MDNDLGQQLEALSARVRHLEQVLEARGLLGVAHDSAPAAPPPQASTVARAPQRPPLRPPPAARPAPRDSKRDSKSFEARLGSQIFNRIGIFAMLVGMAWFLKFAIDNEWIGPLGRVMIGLIAGAAIIAWSEWFRRRGYPLFSYSLKAVGSGTLYLSIWAAYGLYHFIPPGVAFGLMIVVTAWNGFMAWVQDAELLGLYAIIGGFCTPALVSTGENHELVLFSYMLVLNIAVLVLIMFRPWLRLILSAFIGTLLLANGWAGRFYTDQAFALTASFVTLFFILFAIAPRFARVSSDKATADDTAKGTHAQWQSLALVLLPLANAALSFYMLYNMLDPAGRQWARPWVAVVFAAFYLILLQRPPRQSDADRSRQVSALDLTSAVVFLTMAIPLQAHGHWLVTGWLVEGGALLWMAQRIPLRLLRTLAIGALLLGLGSLLQMDPDTPGMIVFNSRFATYLVGIVVFAVVAWLSAKREDERAESVQSNASNVLTLDTTVPWRMIAAASVVTVNLLILLSVRWEIHAYWRANADTPPRVDLTPFASYGASRSVMYEEFGYSMWAMLFGAMLLAVGFWKRSAFIRWQALLLLTLSIAKVFVVDVGALSQGYRVLSFLGLGALLLAISFAYQRDWLGLRAAEASAAPGPVE